MPSNNHETFSASALADNLAICIHKGDMQAETVLKNLQAFMDQQLSKHPGGNVDVHAVWLEERPWSNWIEDIPGLAHFPVK